MRLVDNNELVRYLLKRNDILVSINPSNDEEIFRNETNETALDRYPNSLFNKKVSLLDDEFVGFMMNINDTSIVVFGDYDERFDVPKSKASEVNNNIVLNMEWNEFITYKKDNFSNHKD